MIKTRPRPIQVKSCRHCGKSVYFDLSIHGNLILLEFVTQNRRHCIGQVRQVR